MSQLNSGTTTQRSIHRTTSETSSCFPNSPSNWSARSSKHTRTSSGEADGDGPGERFRSLRTEVRFFTAECRDRRNATRFGPAASLSSDRVPSSRVPPVCFCCSQIMSLVCNCHTYRDYRASKTNPSFPPAQIEPPPRLPQRSRRQD